VFLIFVFSACVTLQSFVVIPWTVEIKEDYFEFWPFVILPINQACNISYQSIWRVHSFDTYFAILHWFGWSLLQVTILVNTNSRYGRVNQGTEGELHLSRYIQHMASHHPQMSLAVSFIGIPPAEWWNSASVYSKSEISYMMQAFYHVTRITRSTGTVHTSANARFTSVAILFTIAGWRCCLSWAGDVMTKWPHSCYGNAC